MQRAIPFANQADAGNVALITGEWNAPFLEEAELFPDGQFKDQIDAASGCINELTLKPQLTVHSF